MSHEIKIHPAQTSILRELLFHPHAGYAVLQKPTGLTSDHFNFHISRLVEIGYVTKESKGRYKLSANGKEYANKLDTDNNTIERQPKIAVLLVIERVNPAGDKEYLFQQRLKQPWFGYWCFPTGKIRWGESIIETAERELFEETGLEATCTWLGLYHERPRLEGDADFSEDKIFNIIHCTNPSRVLIEDFEGGHNEWLTYSQIIALPKKFQSWELEFEFLEKRKNTLLEETPVYAKEEF